MAVYNEIQVGRYVRFLQKFLGIKGRQPAPLTFGGEIGATWPLFHGVENRYLEGWNRFQINLIQPSGVGVFAQIRFRNPTGSNVIAVFEKIDVNNQSAALNALLLDFGVSGTDLTTPVSLVNARLDPRGNPTPSLIASGQAAAAAAIGIVSDRVDFDTSEARAQLIRAANQEMTLLPGDALQLRNGFANINVVATFTWRERVLEESELK